MQNVRDGIAFDRLPFGIVVGAKESWQGADASWCVVAPASSAIPCRPRRLRGTNLGDAATDREDRLPPASDRRTVQTVPGPARSLVGWTPRWLVGQTAQLDLRRPLRYGNCTDSTLGCWGRKKGSVCASRTVVQVEGTDSGSSEGRAVASLCHRAVIVLGRLEFVSARSPGSSDPGCRGSSRVRSRRPTHPDQARRSSNLGRGPQRHQYAGSLLLWCAKSIDERYTHRFSRVTD